MGSDGDRGGSYSKKEAFGLDHSARPFAPHILTERYHTVITYLVEHFFHEEQKDVPKLFARTLVAHGDFRRGSGGSVHLKTECKKVSFFST